VDTLGHLLAFRVTPASADDRAAVAELAEAVQDATGESVTLAYVDHRRRRSPGGKDGGAVPGYTGERAAEAASAHGIALEVVKLPKAKRGFVLLPRRWVVACPGRVASFISRSCWTLGAAASWAGQWRTISGPSWY
jgi:hypothetical protein